MIAGHVTHLADMGGGGLRGLGRGQYRPTGHKWVMGGVSAVERNGVEWSGVEWSGVAGAAAVAGAERSGGSGGSSRGVPGGTEGLGSGAAGVDGVARAYLEGRSE